MSLGIIKIIHVLTIALNCTPYARAASFEELRLKESAPYSVINSILGLRHEGAPQGRPSHKHRSKTIEPLSIDLSRAVTSGDSGDIRAKRASKAALTLSRTPSSDSRLLESGVGRFRASPRPSKKLAEIP